MTCDEESVVCMDWVHHYDEEHAGEVQGGTS